MPKLGTRAALLFFDSATAYAAAAGSPRENGEDCEDMADTQARAFTTEHGKRLGLYPEELLLSGGDSGKTLRVRLSQLDGMLWESAGNIQIIAKMKVSVTAPHVILQTPREIRINRSPKAARGGTSLIIPKGSASGNPPTGGGGDTILTMRFQFNALGECGLLAGRHFKVYFPYPDQPDETLSVGGWLANILLGAAVVAVCLTVAFLVPGVGPLLAGSMACAALGAAVATVEVAVSDYQNKQARSHWEVAGRVLQGASTGAFVVPVTLIDGLIEGKNPSTIGMDLINQGMLGLEPREQQESQSDFEREIARLAAEDDHDGLWDLAFML
jgi:hypothetical protein